MACRCRLGTSACFCAIGNTTRLGSARPWSAACRWAAGRGRVGGARRQGIEGHDRDGEAKRHITTYCRASGRVAAVGTFPVCPTDGCCCVMLSICVRDSALTASARCKAEPLSRHLRPRWQIGLRGYAIRKKLGPVAVCASLWPFAFCAHVGPVCICALVAMLRVYVCKTLCVPAGLEAHLSSHTACDSH